MSYRESLLPEGSRLPSGELALAPRTDGKKVVIRTTLLVIILGLSMRYRQPEEG